MSSKTPRPQQVALARKAAALKAAAKAKAPPQTRQGVRERNVRARIAADAYVAEQEQRQEEPRARLLSKRQVLDRVCVTFPTLWKWMRAGTFPRARVIGGKSVWLEHEVNAWIAGLPVRRLKGDASEIEVA
jgi:predicted DNA-binding transcriptional regulator AlpA